MTSPEVERAALHYVCAHREREWAGRRSNPRYLIFSQVLYRLSYQPKFFVQVGLFDRQESQRKRPGVFLTPGLVGSSKSKTKCQFRLFFSLAGA